MKKYIVSLLIISMISNQGFSMQQSIDQLYNITSTEDFENKCKELIKNLCEIYERSGSIEEINPDMCIAKTERIMKKMENKHKEICDEIASKTRSLNFLKKISLSALCIGHIGLFFSSGMSAILKYNLLTTSFASLLLPFAAENKYIQLSFGCLLLCNFTSWLTYQKKCALSESEKYAKDMKNCITRLESFKNLMEFGKPTQIAHTA